MSGKMSNYNDPSPSHRNALQQVNETRQRALNAVEEMRQVSQNRTHRNLSPAGDDPSLESLANQVVVSYLLQLRPYRENSRKWHTELGQLELPKELPGDVSKRRDGDRGPPYRICRSPVVNLSPVTHLAELINTDILYSTTRPVSPTPKINEEKLYELRLPDETLRVPKDQALAFHQGAISRDELRRVAKADGDDSSEDEFQPATPVNGKIKRFKFVFGPDRLLQLVELADEVAAEMDLLIELEDPDFDAGGRGAV